MLWLLILISSLVFLLAVLLLLVIIKPPREANSAVLNAKVVQSGENAYRLGNNWFRKSRSGLWELYAEGSAWERGIAIGKLTRDLIYRQEAIFVKEIRKIIPSGFYLFFLKVFVAIMNRRLPAHIGKEYCSEIHGISLSASSKFDFIGPRYQRFLNYHAAHDIGHILQHMNLVGCTSFAVWGEGSADGKLIAGRNFDFHIGDDFSEEKIVSFYAPDKGHRFVCINWGGMIGAVSGMNEHGLVITVNAAKSEFPNHSATPISLVVRELLQYARNINETFAITQKKNIFVSESLLVSSAEDNMAVIIEKSNRQSVLLRSQENQLICTNHFQSPELRDDRQNVKYMNESPTTQRYARVRELLEHYPKTGLAEFVSILRDKQGTGGKDIGMGNEQAIDQLLAHHSIIFKPSELKFWICSGPYAEGSYQAYDLKKIFGSGAKTDETHEICDTSLEIPPDSFLNSEKHENFRRYKELLSAFCEKKQKTENLAAKAGEFIASNPEMFAVYSALGDYFLRHQQFERAIGYYMTGLTKSIPNRHEKKHIQKGLKKARRKKTVKS